MASWVQSLPTPNKLRHPLRGWPEDEQETLQFSSTKQIYDQLDNADEDAAWWKETVWEPHRDVFPESVNGEDSFTPDGFKWALALVDYHAVFLDKHLHLVPVLDLANHGYGTSANDKPQELPGGSFRTFGTTKGACLLTTSGKDGGVC